MPQLTKIENNLNRVFTVWNALGDDQKREKINLMMPLVQFSSFLFGLHYITKQKSSQQYKNLLDFHNEYKRLFDADLVDMQMSDFSPNLANAIQNIKTRKLTEPQREAMFHYDKKYIHAHNRVMFNYGGFLNEIFAHLSLEKQNQITQMIKDMQRSDDDIASVLLEINNAFELEKNSAILQKDDLENHALLNQMSNYLQIILQSAQLLQSDEQALQINDSLRSSRTGKFAIQRNNTDEKVDPNFEKVLQEKNLQIQVGIESEFLLHPLEQNEDLSSPILRNVRLKKALADLNARRKMQTKYGYEPTVPSVDDDTLFFEDVTVSAFKAEEKSLISDNDYRQITRHLEQFLTAIHTAESSRGTFTSVEEIRKAVANFTEAETFFYKFFFLEETATELAIEMDGVFDPRKTQEKNVLQVWELMKKGRLHENLLDMIQAHEIAIGPHSISEISDKKDDAFRKMRLTANLSGCSLDNPNVQLNYSMQFGGHHVLLPQIERQDDGQTKMYISSLGVEFVRLIQETIVENSDIVGLFRHQKEVAATFDRNKHIGTKLAGTEFRQVDPEIPAFLTHKQVAAKNTMLRLSAINDDVAVLEIRLIGNNPHFAKFDEACETYQDGLEFTQILNKKISEKIQKFVKEKTYEELFNLNATRSEILPNGSIVNLPPKTLGVTEFDHIYDSQAQARYLPTKPLEQVQLVPYQEAKTLSGKGLEIEPFLLF